ncbi:tubulin alpha chain-like [Sycon ciliatum]|uniref:tubulin alpha chain-like n=1 Tax=Sycon ciliatum TaxID=27933 RepID=UPI0020AAD430|eukprot:scpid45664/ scgid12310/ Tubulin alpha chain
MSSREVLSIHIGQAGVQMGAAAWELYCMEHGISNEGQLNLDASGSEVRRESNDSGIAHVDNCSLEPCSTFFAENGAGKFTPRALFIDLEPNVVDVIRTGDGRRLFHPDQMISGQEDAANIFARGCFSVGRTIGDRVEDRIRKMTEHCDSLQGFIITDSSGGGTGSGFGSKLLNVLDVDFAKEIKMEVCVQPSPNMSSAVVEPYNGILHHGYVNGSSGQRNGCCFIVQNESMYGVCKKQLDIERPSFSHVNALLAQVTSSLTASLRFPGTLNVDLAEFQTNLLPFPSLRYPLTSFAPLISVEKAHYEQQTTATITRQCIEKEQQLACCDPARGKYMTCCFLYRGDISPSDVYKSRSTLKQMRSMQFVDWCPSGFKVGINRVAPVVTPGSGMAPVPRSACLLYNSSAISQTWENTIKQFNMLMHKRAFVHWYVGEGMEEGEFTESLENILVMQKDYEEATSDTVVADESEEEF